MTKRTYGIIASVVVVTVLAATPLVISQKIDASLKKEADHLAKNGFKTEELSKSGYFTTKRTFSLEVTDARKARDFLLAQLVEKNAQYKLFAQSLQQGSEAEINEAINGLQFKGEMSHSNLLPQDVKVSLSLSALPTSVQENLKTDAALLALLTPLLTKGVLGADMLFGSDEKLKAFHLKDIQEELSMDGGKLILNTKDHTLKLDHRGEVVVGSLGVGHQLIAAQAEMMESKSELNSFLYNFTYHDEFNNHADMRIGNYALEINDEFTALKAGLGGLKATSSIEEKNQELLMKAEYTLDKIALEESGESIKMDTFLTNFFLRGVDANAMRKLQTDYNTLLISQTPPSDEVLLADIMALIQHGFTFDLGLIFKGIDYDTMHFKDMSIDTTLALAKNSYSNQQSPLALLGLLDISAKVKIHKDDRTLLESLQLTAKKDFALGKAEGDYFIYDINMKNGVLSVNNQAIQ